MSDIHSIEEAYEHLAETLNYLSGHGETIILHPGRPQSDQMISGFSGGVVWKPGKEWGKGWEAYKEG